METLPRDCGNTLAASVTRTPESYPTIVSHDDLTVAVLLVTDRFGVQYTPIGWLLHAPRTLPEPAITRGRLWPPRKPGGASDSR